ncbi:N-acetyltransferase [Falsirhodobacter sp. alg1]|uniref:GNAT family N-acetyltransferase n=1 Tax=Falsirhodobacter sp. alg1 TaxID=1472418 RepID=UPI0005EEA2C5|nr:GNAT family N-acetyltransferase [Falsirhodobacter sp. alg1]
MANLRIEQGLAPEFRDQAAHLYWQAFGPKLGRVMGPDDRARSFISGALQADHTLSAVEGGRLVGLCGFKTARGAFVGANAAAMRSAYGRFGATWRRYALGLLVQDTDNQRFLIDGLCVVPDRRGQGIGTALINAICAEAVTRRYSAIRLDVVDKNEGARRLYERNGFAAIHRHPAGATAALFGFDSTVTMVRQL